MLRSILSALPWLLPVAVVVLIYYLSGQRAHPKGWLGRIWMARLFNESNRKILDAALRALDARTGEVIADIGFGGGYAIEKLLSLVHPAKPIGVEVSETMIDEALNRWDDDVDLYLATVSAMPITTASLDGVLCVDTIHFWGDPASALLEIRRILKPGGRLVLGARRGMMARLSPLRWFRYRLYSQHELEELLRKSGFESSFEDHGASEFIAVAKPA